MLLRHRHLLVLLHYLGSEISFGTEPSRAISCVNACKVILPSNAMRTADAASSSDKRSSSGLRPCVLPDIPWLIFVSRTFTSVASSRSHACNRRALLAGSAAHLLSASCSRSTATLCITWRACGAPESSTTCASASRARQSTAAPPVTAGLLARTFFCIGRIINIVGHHEKQLQQHRRSAPALE